MIIYGIRWLWEISGRETLQCILFALSEHIQFYFKSNLKKSKIGTSLLVGTVDKNPPANARDIGSIPGPGGFHVPQSNLACGHNY